MVAITKLHLDVIYVKNKYKDTYKIHLYSNLYRLKFILITQRKYIYCTGIL